MCPLCFDSGKILDSYGNVSTCSCSTDFSTVVRLNVVSVVKVFR